MNVMEYNSLPTSSCKTGNINLRAGVLGVLVVAVSCQKLAGRRLEPSRVEKRDHKPPRSGETDVSKHKVKAVSM